MLSATACGSSSKPKAAPSSTNASQTTTTTTTIAAKVSDKATARAIALRISDFPAGWTSTPHQESKDDPGMGKQFSDCMGLPVDKLIPDSESVDSPDFHTGSGADEKEVQNSVGIGSADDVDKAFDILASDKLPQCFKEALDASLKKQPGLENATVGAAKVEPLSVGEFGEKTIAYRVSVTVSARGISLDVYIDFVFIKVGNVGIMLSTQSLSQPFDNDLRTQLLNAVVDRAKAAA